MSIENERDLYQAVGRMEVKLDTALADHERLNKLERTLDHRSWIGGGALALVVLLVDPKQWQAWLDLVKKVLPFT